MTKQDLESKLKQLIEQARSMVESCDSVESIDKITKEIAQTRAELDSLERLEEQVEQAQKVTQKSQPTQLTDRPQTRMVAGLQAVLEDPQFRAILQSRKGRYVAQAVTIPTPTYTYESVANYLTPRPSVVGTLVSTGTRAQAITMYAQETTTSVKGSAAPVSKGGTKPETSLTYQAVQSTAQIIAHLLKLSEQDLDDINGLQTIIQQRGLDMLAQVEEDQVINGTGTAPALLGLLNVSGVGTSTQGTDTLIDAIIKAITSVASKGAVPSAIVCSYATWGTLQTAKDSNGQYLLPASLTTGVGNIRGVPLVASPHIANNKVIVGDSRYATLWRVGGVAIEVDREGSDFASNLVTMRIEERAALDVYRPEAYHVLTLA